MPAIDSSIKRQPPKTPRPQPTPAPSAPAPLSGPGATSGYGPGGVLQSQVQGVQGAAPSHLADLGEYFKAFQPDTRLPQQPQMGTVGQQYGAFAPQHSRFTPGVDRQPQANVPYEEWVDVPARKLGFAGGPSGTVRVKKSSLAAQNGGQFGVVGY